MIASRNLGLPEPDPFLEKDQADKLASILENFPRPVGGEDGPPSKDYLEGFEQFRAIAVAIVCWSASGA